MDQSIVEKFTTHLKSVLVRAYTLAHELGQPAITPDHLLWSLLTEKGCLGAELLQKAKVSQERVRETIAGSARRPAGGTTAAAVEAVIPSLADTTKRAIEKAVLTANLHEHKYVGTEHLLSGLLQIGDEALLALLGTERVDVDGLKRQVTAVLTSTSKFPEIANAAVVAADGLAETEAREEEREDEATAEPLGAKRAKRGGSKSPALDFFTVDLTGPEAQKRIDPLVGRAAEIERVIQVLSRRTKNNPVLIGDPGVGKTAIVEGLAKRITEAAVPEPLLGKRVLALDLALIVAGTVYRGEFEGRVKQVIDEVKARPDVILFIDEVHTISGTGSASGSMDAANILKPALARGEIRCIGATTSSEYKKFIEADPALERRFQPVDVREPTADETRAILAGVRRQYEAFHNVTVTDEAVEAAVALGSRYLQDRAFPDKAIDLMDEAAAAARLVAGRPERPARLDALEKELAGVRQKKQEAVRAERFVEALELKEREAALVSGIAGIRKSGEAAVPVASIGRREIAAVVARMTGIPLPTVLAEGTAELADLEERLGRRIVGQEAVIRAVSDHLRRARAGLTDPKRPLASFLFLGPSGVGKTSLAAALAEEVFHDPKALIRLDMSEFAEPFTASKLLGAPAGYVGYRDATKLTDVVKRRPYSVVLFDEVEKAHPDVLNLLLQVLEDGQCTDATGRPVHFRHAIVVLTSNVGLERLRRGGLGFSDGALAPSELAADARKEAESHFRPELLNRLDALLVFRSLAKTDLEAVIRRGFTELDLRLAPRKIRLRVTPAAVARLAELSDTDGLGARAVRRLLQERVEAPLAERILADDLGRGRTFTVDARQGELKYTVR